MQNYLAILLDRDGVINLESSEYIKSPDEWQPIAGSIEAISQLTKARLPVAIITNQSGIGRGLYDAATLNQIHDKLIARVNAAGGYISNIYYCPHLPSDNCECRKPKPKMLQQALSTLGVQPTDAVFIGDSLSDIEAAQACGCDPVVVTTGHGHQTKTKVAKHIPIYESLAMWAEDFLKWQSKHFR